jgi:predicted AlkP superfamily phosphohydrolase/phosphomutase
LSPNHATGGVRINLVGRERTGIVEPGPEYDALCQRLGRDLPEIVNLDTGQPLVESVVQTRSLYKGPKHNLFPDLLLEWNKAGPIRHVRSPLFGDAESHTPRLRTGDHTFKPGFFLATGPGVAPGKLDRTARVVDFAPTLATLLGYSNAQYQGSAIFSGAGR